MRSTRSGPTRAKSSVLTHTRVVAIDTQGQRIRTDRGPVRRAYHQMEVAFGEFRTEVELPVAIDSAKVDAEYADGFLRIVLPKLKPQNIVVQE